MEPQWKVGRERQAGTMIKNFFRMLAISAAVICWLASVCLVFSLVSRHHSQTAASLATIAYFLLTFCAGTALIEEYL
jgi:hypothetical protein